MYLYMFLRVCHVTSPVPERTNIKCMRRQLLCLKISIFFICFLTFGSILLP